MCGELCTLLLLSSFSVTVFVFRHDSNGTRSVERFVQNTHNIIFSDHAGDFQFMHQNNPITVGDEFSRTVGKMNIINTSKVYIYCSLRAMDDWFAFFITRNKHQWRGRVS